MLSFRVWTHKQDVLKIQEGSIKYMTWQPVERACRFSIKRNIYVTDVHMHSRACKIAYIFIHAAMPNR